MRNIRAYYKVLVILVTVAMLPQLLSVKASAAPKSNGSFIIELFDGSAFKQLASVSCDEFQKEFKVSLDRVTNPLLRIRKAADGLAFLDSVLLDGRAATGSKKLMKTDFDVQEITAEGVELRFDGSFDGSLCLTGRIEPEVIIGEPFMFPFENTFIDDPQDLQNFFTYELGSNTRSVQVDGIYENQGKTFESRYLVPATGHPNGYAYIYISNDDRYLYASADFTSDNTFDYGEDYFKVFVNQGGIVKEFKQTSSGHEYGAGAMQYTDKVEYEHMYYEVKIPIDQLGGTDELQLAFSLYGTSAMSVLTSNPTSHTIAAGHTAHGILRINNFWGSALGTINYAAPGLNVQFQISSAVLNNHIMDVPYTVQGTTPGNYTINVTGGSLINGNQPYSLYIGNDYPIRVQITDETYTVSYHPNGGSGTAPMDMNRYYSGNKVTLLPGTELAKAGCTFKGWALADGTIVTDPYIMGNSDVTLFAVWEEGSQLKVPKTGDGENPFGYGMAVSGVIGLAAVMFIRQAKRRKA